MASKEEIRKEFNDYIESHTGLIHPSPPPSPPSDNGIRFTAEAILALESQGDPDGADLLRGRYLSALENCRNTKGHFRRMPSAGHPPNQQDDYIGIFTVAPVRYSQEILEEGSRRWWIIHTEQPGKISRESIFFRWPYFKALTQLGAFKMPSLWGKLMIALNLYLISRTPPKNQDGWLLGYMQVKLIKEAVGLTGLMGVAARHFLKKMKGHFASPGECFGQYCQNFEHPIVKYYKYDI